MTTTPMTPLTRILLLLSLLGTGFLLAWAYQGWLLLNTTRQIAVAHLQLQHGQRLQHDRETQLTARDALAPQVSVHPAAWSWSDQLPLMVQQLADVMEPRGVKLEALQPQPPVAREQLTRYPLRVTVRTTLERLTAVLAQCRQARPILAIDTMTVRTGQVAADPLQVELTISSYVMQETVKSKGAKK